MKVLVIRFGSIGDIVLTTPVIRCLKRQLENATVHYITKKEFAPVLENNPHIDKLYVIEKGISEIEKKLKKENYDLLIDLHHNLRSAQLKTILRKRSNSFSKLNIQKWLMVNLKMNRLPDVHIVDRYFETVLPLGIKNDGNGLDYFIPAKDEIALTTLPPEFQQGYIGFVIGAKFMTKQLPAEKIVSIIQKINQPVILLGGKDDRGKGDWIASNLALLPGGQKSNISNPVFNTCGKYNLNQSASLVKQARKIITHDTGLMHIAAAFRKEIISVWGNTIPEFGMYPYYGISQVPGLRSQVPGLSCRPCSKLGFAKCPQRHFKCMKEINEEEIVRFVQT